jgi:hypothetical protein
MSMSTSEGKGNKGEEVVANTNTAVLSAANSASNLQKVSFQLHLAMVSRPISQLASHATRAGRVLRRYLLRPPCQPC